VVIFFEIFHKIAHVAWGIFLMAKWQIFTTKKITDGLQEHTTAFKVWVDRTKMSHYVNVLFIQAQAHVKRREGG
jgi:hypothetical protein